MTDGPYPSTDLYWYDDRDPTIAPGMAAPLKQILIRTDVPSIYYKAGLADTAWVLIGTSGGGGGGGVDIAAGSQTATSGTVKFANLNNVSFGMLGSSQVTASVAALQSIFLGSLSTSIFGGATINPTTISGTAISEVSFSDFNGVSFGLNGANSITASHDGIRFINAGSNNVTEINGGVSFVDGNGVSFGGNSAVGFITASVAAGATATGNLGGIGAGTQTVTAGTVIFANGSGVTFGMNASTVTASVAAETPFGISAGSQSVSTGTVSFANSNGISFGMSGSNQITVSVDANGSYSQFSPYYNMSSIAANPGQSSLQLQPVTFPNVAFSQLGFLCSFNHSTASTGSASFSVRFGLYTSTGGSLSLLHSTSISFTAAYSSTSSVSLFVGMRLVTLPWTSTITRGNYWAGAIMASSTSSQDCTFNLFLNNSIGAVLSGLFGVASNATNQCEIGQGIYSAQTAAFPASVAYSEIRGTQARALQPVVWSLGHSV